MERVLNMSREVVAQNEEIQTLLAIALADDPDDGDSSSREGEDMVVILNGHVYSSGLA